MKYFHDKLRVKLTSIDTDISAPKHKRSIKDEVGDMINQLKSDLENLLRFNENLLSFNSSIVKKAVKSKVHNVTGKRRK